MAGLVNHGVADTYQRLIKGKPTWHVPELLSLPCVCNSI